MTTAAAAREALRQQMLLRALWRDARPGVVAGWLRDAPARATRGLQAYQANAGALAERALRAAFPTIAMLVGDESFGALARVFWHANPPLRGDIAQWGESLPTFIEADAQLASEPYLADVARVDWAVHRAESAAGAAPVQGLERLADADPAALTLRLAPGAALVSSPHPVATIWLAHHAFDAATTADRFAPVREAFARGGGEHAFVRREGLVARVTGVSAAEARVVQALLEARSLDTALQRAGEGFGFEAWLAAALGQGWLAACEPLPLARADV
jgi:hypothetical protein